MAQTAGSEAITVVIEKLTEIVEGSQSQEAEWSDSSPSVLRQNNHQQCNMKEEYKQASRGDVVILSDKMSETAVHQQEIQPGTVLSDPDVQYTMVRENVIEHPDKENDKQGSSHQQIVLNLPPGVHSLSTADPQALLQTLIQMTSSGDLTASPTHFIQTSNQLPQNTTQFVETIGAEMVIPANSVYVASTQITSPDKLTDDQTIQLQTAAQAKTIVKSNGKGGGNGKELLKCAKCDYCSHNKHYLKQHVDLVHNADRPFKCPFCDYAGKRSHSLKEHLVVHSTNRPFECPICNASFRKKGHLTNHIRLHNTFKYFECSICQNKYQDRSLLYMHLRTAHDPSQVYECKVCEYATTIKSNIVMHMHTHGNPEVYRCSICSFTALHINILKQHMQTHSANKANLYKIEKPGVKARPVILLKCSVCGYTTDKKDALQKHMWQHLPECSNTEMPVPTTSETTNSTETTVSTTAAVDGQKEGDQGSSIYNCTECSYSCQEAYLFITHMLAHHPRQKLIADQQKQQQQLKQQQSLTLDKVAETSKQDSNIVAFTHDSAAGMYRCTICGYMCEQQRTIKAHIWKHSGHKDIDYPMFQNGPLSVYDDTPVGKTMLLSEKSKKAPIKMIPKPDVGVADHKEDKQTDNDHEQNNLETKIDDNNAGIVKITSHKKIAPPPSTEALQSILPNQPIKFAIQQLNTDPATVLPFDIQSQLNSILGPNIRLITPLQTTNIIQSMSAGNLTPAAASPEIVQLILGSGQGSIQNLQDASALIENPNKRKITVEQSVENDALVGVAKRLCLEEVGNACSTTGGNVVVQQMSQIYTTPTITIASSGLTPQLHPSVLADDMAQHQVISLQPEEPVPCTVEEANQADVTIVDVEPNIVEADTETTNGVMVMEVEIETRSINDNSSNYGEELVDVEKEEEVTLVKLLKKGPNYNPVCPGSAVEPGVDDATTGMDTDPSDVDSENAHSEESKQKKGICSSLLAVIEQLRERSKSESESEHKSDGSIEKTKADKPTKAGPKRKSRRSSAEDDTPIEQYSNVEKINSNPAQYRCKLCHYSSTTTGVIKNHMRLHKTKQPFECSLCDYQAGSSETLQEHMLQHCKVRTYHCKVCTAVFNYKSQLRAHMRAHNEKEPFLCDLCDYETSNPIAFRNHSRIHTEKKDEALKTATAIASPTEKSVSVDSGTERDLVCDECEYEADSTSDLMVHIRSQHPVTYKCDQCEQQCTTWNAFSAHLKMHLEVRTLKCELCDFVATSMRSLKSHMKRHINDQRFVQQPLEQYKCNLCGYVCHHLPSLKSHMWRHASDKNYSYQLTNDVINAAIDYDTNSTVTKSEVKSAETPGKQEIPVSETEATDTGLAEDDTTRLAALAQLEQDHTSALTRPPTLAPPPAVLTRPCLVTFRCCQCGFESLNKSVLNNHMKTHLDIIRKTLEVNKSQLVQRAMKEIGHGKDKDRMDGNEDEPQVEKTVVKVEKSPDTENESIEAPVGEDE